MVSRKWKGIKEYLKKNLFHIITISLSIILLVVAVNSCIMNQNSNEIQATGNTIAEEKNEIYNETLSYQKIKDRISFWDESFLKCSNVSYTEIKKLENARIEFASGNYLIAEEYLNAINKENYCDGFILLTGAVTGAVVGAVKNNNTIVIMVIVLAILGVLIWRVRIRNPYGKGKGKNYKPFADYY